MSDGRRPSRLPAVDTIYPRRWIEYYSRDDSVIPMITSVDIDAFEFQSRWECM
jgi:hypothetical protein